MIRPPPQMVLPETLIQRQQTSHGMKRQKATARSGKKKAATRRGTHLSPESVPVHVPVVVAERGVGKRPPFDIHVVELAHISSHNLVRIHKYNLERRRTQSGFAVLKGSARWGRGEWKWRYLLQGKWKDDVKK